MTLPDYSRLGVLCAALLLTACTSTPEQHFQAHRQHYHAMAGPTDEPSCGGTWEVVWVDDTSSDRYAIARIYWSIETSRRFIERDYYAGARPVVVIETSHFLLDAEANRLKTPRLEYTRRYDFTKPGTIPPGKKRELEKHGEYLERYFAMHGKDFKFLPASQAALLP